jgi:DHA1 family bicyclomycin/chloramphenicol resistance-like MFS transporter
MADMSSARMHSGDGEGVEARHGGLAGLAVPMFAFVAATGLIVANAAAGALASYPKQAGAVSALFGAMQYGGGILGSALVGILADGTAWPMGLVVAFGGVGTLLCARILPGSGRVS